MDVSNRSAEHVGAEIGLKLDFTGLLGATQVFAAGNDPQMQAELIDANCNKIGEVTCA